MKTPAFSLFAPSFHCRATTFGPVLSLLLAIPALAAITPGGTNTYNGSTAANGLATGGSWTLGSPNGTSGAGSYTDLLFEGTDGSNFTSSGGTNTNIYAQSYNVVNGSAYTLQLNSSNSASFQTGSTSSNGTSPSTIAFTNSVSGVGQNMIYLSGGSDLTFIVTNGGGGSNTVMNLRQAGNFNVGTGSILTINPAILGGSSNHLSITGSGTTIFNGANTYAGSTTIAGGTLEISGTNAGTSYTVNGSDEPALKLSNLNALPASATISGSNSISLDGSVDLAVAGAYTMGSYERGHITFTASGGSPTSLTFTNASAITSGANSARVFTNGSADLGITFASTLDIGGDNAANVTLNAVGDITVDDGIISTGDGTRSLIKSGGGTLTLNGTSVHTGATTVSAGTLYITGALSNSAVTVEASGTIGSDGIAGALGNGLTIEAGGNLDLTGASLGLNSTGILSLTGGSLTLGNLIFEDLVGWDWANADPGTYELIDGSFSIDWGDTAYLTPETAYVFENGNKGYFTSGSLNVVIIPEPRAALLGGLGLLALLRRRRN